MKSLLNHIKITALLLSSLLVFAGVQAVAASAAPLNSAVSVDPVAVMAQDKEKKNRKQRAKKRKEKAKKQRRKNRQNKNNGNCNSKGKGKDKIRGKDQDREQNRSNLRQRDSQHQQAYDAHKRGEIRPYDKIKRGVETQTKGKIVGQKLLRTNQGWIYQLMVRGQEGRISLVVVDAASGKILKK